ncbi:MAG: TolC family protein [Gammaproteobacteria bacterium]
MRRLTLVCAALVAPHVASGAASGVNTLATATQAAWHRALQARESAGRAATAAAERRVASALWADTPALELSHRTGDWGNNPGERESEIAIAWPTWLPGQRAAHRQAAAAGVELAAIAEDEARLRLAGEVRELAWRLAALAAEEQGRSRQAEHLAALAQDVERRVAARESPRADSLAARSESLNAQNAALEARQALDAARAEWTLLTGLTEIGDPSEEPPPLDAGSAIDDHPTVRLAIAEAAHARAQLRAARRTPIDTPELRVLYREEVAMEGLPVDRSLGVGLRIPLGGARNAPRNAAARGAAELADVAAERAREAQESAVALARAALDRAGQRYDAAQSRAVLLRERFELLERSYRARETSLSEILRERHALAEAEMALARGHAAFGLARARLRQSLGMLP